MFFATVRHQLFDGQLWCPLFLLSSKCFDARIFLIHRKDHLQSFSALWEKRFPTKISDITLPCKKCFDTRFFLKHGSGPLRKFSALWDKKFPIEITDMPFLCFRFFGTGFFLKHWRVPLRNILVMRDKKCVEKSWYTTSSLIKKFCENRISLKHRRVPYEVFRYSEAKILTKNCDTASSSLIHKVFRYPKFSETQTCSPTNLFDTVRQKVIKRI